MPNSRHPSPARFWSSTTIPRCSTWPGRGSSAAGTRCTRPGTAVKRSGSWTAPGSTCWSATCSCPGSTAGPWARSWWPGAAPCRCSSSPPAPRTSAPSPAPSSRSPSGSTSSPRWCRRCSPGDAAAPGGVYSSVMSRRGPMSVVYAVVLAVGLLGVVACYTAFEPEDPDPVIVTEASRDVPVRVFTDRTEYAEGDEMTVAIANESPVEARYSLCPGTWDRLAGEAWLRSEQLMSCATELGVVQGGTTVTEKVTVPPGLL